MAIGDQADFISRLLRLLPRGWFPNDAPRLNAVLQGAASSFAAIFDMLAFVKAQTRVNTASGSFLDIISRGYFAGQLPRLQYESDAAYAERITYNLTAPRGTRDGMLAMLTQLVGGNPIVFQPNMPGDAMCLASINDINAAGPGTALHGKRSSQLSPPYADFGYSPTTPTWDLGWGSLLLPCQVLVVVPPPVTGYAIYVGYTGFGAFSEIDAGGYGGLASFVNPDVAGPGLAIVNPDALPGAITNDYIYQQVMNWMPAGYVAQILIANLELISQ